MKPDAVGTAIADDLKQHQWFRLAVKARESELCDDETLMLGAAQLAHRAYTVYQSCVYEAMARGERFEFAPDGLALDPKPGREPRGEVYFRADAFDDVHVYDNLLNQLHDEVPDCFHEETKERSAWIQLDPAVEHHLAAGLEPWWFDKCSELAVAESLTKFADASVNEIGKVIVTGVRSRQRVEINFLGSLQWDGESARVEFTPNGILLEHIRMPQLQGLLKDRRSQR